MSQQRISISRGQILGTIIVLAIALACVRLGIWQLHRLEQKRQRNHAVRTRMAEPPVVFGSLPMDTSGLIFRRTTVTGTYDDARTIIVAGRSLDGVPGVHVLTPLRIGASAVLVNRGWVPSSDARQVDLEAIREGSPQDVQAVVVSFPDDPRAAADSAGTFKRVWYRMSYRAVQPQFPYRVAPYVVQLLAAGNSVALPRRLAAPELDEGPHLGYAIQWFSFAVIGIVGWLIVLLRGRSRRQAP